MFRVKFASNTKLVVSHGWEIPELNGAFNSKKHFKKKGDFPATHIWLRKGTFLFCFLDAIWNMDRATGPCRAKGTAEKCQKCSAAPQQMRSQVQTEAFRLRSISKHTLCATSDCWHVVFVVLPGPAQPSEASRRAKTPWQWRTDGVRFGQPVVPGQNPPKTGGQRQRYKTSPLWRGFTCFFSRL